MSPERWQQVKPILEQSLDLESAAREAFLSEACGGDPELEREVRSLIVSSEESEGLLETPALEALSGKGHAPPIIGSRIGSYLILEEIGHGGMGAVYRAVREEFQHQVAIKLLRPGPAVGYLLDQLRFERQILAFLNHPSIARLLDGGATAEGLPYLVMEYISGTPITEYCKKRALSLIERMRLFLEVCAAVEHAHCNLIVHRDLKPGNILITAEGQPKLLDFGVAKILLPQDPDASKTSEFVRLFTPDYASPEQVRGEPVTTGTDVYSLGVILFEILTGQRPFHFDGAASLEIERILSTTDPPRPSTVIASGSQPTLTARALRGDLDNIILKALDKDPARRYASVEQLSEDLRRFIDGRPVTARPDSLGYRISKFMRRNRRLVLSGSLALAGLLTGLLAAVWQVRVTEKRLQHELAAAYEKLGDAHASRGDGAQAMRYYDQARRLLITLEAKGEGDPAIHAELAGVSEKLNKVPR